MKIGIVNDQIEAVSAIRHALAATARHHVAWVAHHGAEAVSMCALDKPDLILMELVMPVMDGIEATRRIMAETPCPILVVTTNVNGNSSKVFEALGVGAIDAIDTPVLETAASPIPTPPIASVAPPSAISCQLPSAIPDISFTVPMTMSKNANAPPTPWITARRCSSASAAASAS